MKFQINKREILSTGKTISWLILYLNSKFPRGIPNRLRSTSKPYLSFNDESKTGLWSFIQSMIYVHACVFGYNIKCSLW